MHWFGFRRSTSAPSTRHVGSALYKLDNTQVVIAHNADWIMLLPQAVAVLNWVFFGACQAESWLPSLQFLGTGLFRQAIVAQDRVTDKMHKAYLNETRRYT